VWTACNDCQNSAFAFSANVDLSHHVCFLFLYALQKRTTIFCFATCLAQLILWHFWQLTILFFQLGYKFLNCEKSFFRTCQSQHWFPFTEPDVSITASNPMSVSNCSSVMFMLVLLWFVWRLHIFVPLNLLYCCPP